MLKKELVALKSLREDATSHVLWGLCFMDLVGGKGQTHRARPGIPVSKVLVNRLPATRLQGQVLMLISGHLWRRSRGRRFCPESRVVRGPWDHTGQDETRVIVCFFALSVPWSFHP